MDFQLKIFGLKPEKSLVKQIIVLIIVVLEENGTPEKVTEIIPANEILENKLYSLGF